MLSRNPRSAAKSRDAVTALRNIHTQSHALAKQRLRHATVAAMQPSIAKELTLAANRFELGRSHQRGFTGQELNLRLHAEAALWRVR